MLIGLLVGVPRVGAIAGAYCWLALNVGYYLVLVPLMHRRVLRDEIWLWWSRDTMLPLVMNLSVFVLSAHFERSNGGLLASLAQTAITAAVSWALLIAILPAARTELRRLSAGMY
jgi:hypothetical protein